MPFLPEKDVASGRHLRPRVSCSGSLLGGASAGLCRPERGLALLQLGAAVLLPVQLLPVQLLLVGRDTLLWVLDDGIGTQR